jgi:hypothetical protein
MLKQKKSFLARAVEFAVVVASNDVAVLNNSLMRSPEISSKEVVIRRNFASASQAYNSGIDSSTAEIVVFAHQDVFFPDGWFRSVTESINRLSAIDPNWGVLGIYGISLSGEGTGHLYSTGLQRVLGHPFEKPVEISSLDEVVLIVRRSSGLRFDEQLPGFHLYGTDICLESRRAGLKSYAISAFCIHNSNGLGHLPSSYSRALFYMRDKWRQYLPIRTPCMVISRWGIPLMRHYLESLFSLNRKAGMRCDDPSALYARLLKEKQVDVAAQTISA